MFCIKRSKIILRHRQRCFCTFGASVLRTSSCSILACTRIAFEVRHICTMFVCLLIQCTFAHFRGTKRCAICRKFSLLFRITPRTCHTKKSAVREQNVSIDVTKPAFQTKLKNKLKKQSEKKKWRNENDFPPSSFLLTVRIAYGRHIRYSCETIVTIDRRYFPCVKRPCSKSIRIGD